MKRLTFKQIKISGFKSFCNPETLEFPDDPGFYLLTGENRVESDLGANGAGKSTVWDALCWCLYGKTARGVRGPSLVNWDKSALCEVSLQFLVGDMEYVLERTIGPNSLTCNSSVVTQDQLDQVIGLTYIEFLNTALMGQFNPFFFDLSPTEKAVVFNEILDLESWQKASDNARKRSVEIDGNLRTLESKLAGKKEGLKATELHIERLKKMQKEFRGELKKKIDDTKVELSGARTRCKELDEEIAPYVKKMQKSSEDNEEAKIDYVAWVDNRGRLKDEKAKFEGDVKVFDSQLAALNESISNLGSQNGKCSVCRQRIAEEHVKKELRILDTEVRECRSNRDSVQSCVDALTGKLLDLKVKMEENGALIDSTQRDYNRAKEKDAGLRSQWNRQREKITSLESSVTDLTRQLDTDKFKSQIEVSEVDLEKCEEFITTAKDKQKEYIKELSAVEFWTKGFKDLRLWLIDEALKEFEIAVNNGLSQLGLTDWTILFDVERETKSGGVSKGFSVSIVPPGLEEAVPWESWSGGETQRLRIAGAIGLAGLISSRKGVSSNIEVWDEPTAHLSEEGISDLLEFFSVRSRDLEKQIWMVDHRSLNSGDFDGSVQVVKDQRGSHILQ